MICPVTYNNTQLLNGSTRVNWQHTVVAPARKTKQGVYAIINHDNLKQKASVLFVSLKVLGASFCVGVKTKRPTRNLVCIREDPLKVYRVCFSRQKSQVAGTALSIDKTLTFLSACHHKIWSSYKCHIDWILKSHNIFATLFH